MLLSMSTACRATQLPTACQAVQLLDVLTPLWLSTTVLCCIVLCLLLQVLQQPEERVPGGKTASRVALEKLAVKYCTKRGGGPRTSVQVCTNMSCS